MGFARVIWQVGGQVGGQKLLVVLAVLGPPSVDSSASISAASAPSYILFGVATAVYAMICIALYVIGVVVVVALEIFALFGFLRLFGSRFLRLATHQAAAVAHLAQKM